MKYLMLLVFLLAACGQTHSTPTVMPNADQTFAVSLRRTPCFGTCPVYTVTVDAAGIVTFNGHDFVSQTGIHTATLSAEELQQLGTLVDSANIFEMKDEYTIEATDLPSTTVTVTRNGVTKRVRHYGIGCLDGPNAAMSGGAPPALCRLQTGIDTITKTDQWIK